MDRVWDHMCPILTLLGGFSLFLWAFSVCMGTGIGYDLVEDAERVPQTSVACRRYPVDPRIADADMAGYRVYGVFSRRFSWGFWVQLQSRSVLTH